MPVEVRVPVLGESVVEATVGAWLKREGEAVDAGESLVQLETEKVNVDVAADQAGVLGKIARQAGETVHPGDVLAVMDDSAATTAPRSATDSATSASAAESPPASAEIDRPHASPVARRLAEEHGLDLGTVEGTGTGGRVTREDVERHLGAPAAGELAAAAPTPAPQTADRRETRRRMSRRRLTIAQRNGCPEDALLVAVGRQ